ncbi:MAG: type II and III secretion system protein, partial [Candidatus Pacebacteria bacterium]|nr:type II and III secretion system protein [Candidatus Paceibacterota bacterium]
VLEGLAPKIYDVLKQNDLKGIDVRIFGQTVYLAGKMYDEKKKEQAVKIVNSYIEPYGCKVQPDGLMFHEANLVVKVQFVQIDRSKARDLGLKMGDIKMAADLTGDYAESSNWAWSGQVTGGVQATINTLKQNGAGKVVYETDLAAKSGQEAEFQQGGTIYKEVATDNSVGTEAIDFGFIVATTPKMVDKQTIDTEVRVEVSVPVAGAEGDQDLNLSKYSTNSNYTLAPGDSIVLSGLSQAIANTTKSGVPLLSRIPLLGTVFGNKAEDVRSTEALVVVTVNERKRETGAQDAFSAMKEEDVTPELP